jgi:GNAT superfamily N-acetyltransferase
MLVGMLWKIRTELADRPGALAELAARFGTAGINILSLEVFTAQTGAVDELVVSTRAGWTADQLRTLAGGAGTTVRVVQADVLTDGPTRYLRAVARLLDDPCSVDDELERLQGFEEYTPAEWARADVLVEIAARLAERDDVPDEVAEPTGGDTPQPSRRGTVAADRPVLVAGTAADAKAVVEMHDRCSNRSREQRYHAPIARLTARTARHLIEPAGGASVLAWVGGSVVGMASVAPWDDPVAGAGRPMEAAVLVEDGWQHRGLGTALMRRLLRQAGELGADRLLCVVRPDNDAMLRTMASLSVPTRVVPDGSHLQVSVAVPSVGDTADRPGVAYGLSRGDSADSRPANARPAGEHAAEPALAGLRVVPQVPGRARAVDRDGADRGGRS